MINLVSFIFYPTYPDSAYVFLYNLKQNETRQHLCYLEVSYDSSICIIFVIF